MLAVITHFEVPFSLSLYCIFFEMELTSAAMFNVYIEYAVRVSFEAEKIFN